MSPRYRRRYSGFGWTGADWAQHHAEKRARLSARFGGIDHDIESEFLSLHGPALESLLARYGDRYGRGAKAYARTTYAEWKAGRVLMSGQTAERLLDLLPPLLSQQTRFELIRKLRSHCLGTESISISTSLDNWRSAVVPAIEKLVARSRSQNLPIEVLRVASWLSSEDGKLARQLLAVLEEEEARIRTSLLTREFQRIDDLIVSLRERKASLEHLISIPNGEIRVRITSRRRGLNLFRKELSLMKNDDSPSSGLVRSTGGIIARRPDENLLDVAVAGLTEEQADKLRGKALDEKLRLDVTAREADHRFVSSSRDMGGTVRLAQELDQGRNDYEINANYDTASGRTALRVKRATNQTFVIVAVVVAIVLLLVFLNR